MHYQEEIPKYKKKKTQTSKSSKHSNHKHEYEDILMQSFLYSFVWEERCKVCGRIKTKPYYKAVEGTRKNIQSTVFSEKNCYSAQELHELYPDVKIYTRPLNEKGHINFDDNAIIEIKFD